MTEQQARKYRTIIEQGAQILSDAEALTMKTLYSEWTDLAAEGYTAKDKGYKFVHGGDLYKTVKDNLTFASSWGPGVGTESIYTRIDETHDGTKYDPIPAARGMEYEYGKYYLDGEDSKIYLCQRIGEAAGGTIVLQYMPHELIGNYFTEVNA